MKRNGFFIIIEKYCNNGVFFINDIISEDKQFFDISGISKQIYDKYKLSGILWHCVCSPKEIEFFPHSMGSYMMLKMTLLTA